MNGRGDNSGSRVILAGSWQPRGELARLRRYLPRLRELYSAIVVAVMADEPETADVVAALDAELIRYQLFRRWSGRHTTLRLALDAGADYIHYVDMDRLVRWVELRPDELAQTVARLQTVDCLLIGRTASAYATHSKTLIETEALPNAFFSQLMGRSADQVLDLSAGSRAFSRRAAAFILAHNAGGEANALALDAGWAVLIQRGGFTWDYVEVDGLDWETADRFRDRAATADEQQALATAQDADPDQWAFRLKIAQAITRLGLEALTQDLTTVVPEQG